MMTSQRLIDFKQLPHGMISGLEENEINELIEIQELFATDTDLFEGLEFASEEITSKSAFGITDEVKSKLDELQCDSVPKTTRDQQKRYSKKFIEFLQHKGLDTDFAKLSTIEVAEYLRYFYSELRTVNGKLYSGPTLICIRAALCRFFRQPPLNLRFNIITDSEFFNANQVLKVMLKKYREEGGVPQHFEAIEKPDIEKLSTYFDRSSPEKLMEEVFFSIIYYLGCRGREWIRHLRKENVLTKTDSKGLEYIEVAGLNAIKKNSQPSLTKETNDLKQSRIYSSPNPSSCPVRAIKMLLSKLPPECANLFYKKSSIGTHKNTGIIQRCR